MNKEELIQFLKQNLSIQTKITKASYEGEYKTLTIELVLEDEVISSSSEWIE